MSSFGRPNTFGSNTGATGFGTLSNQQNQNSLFGSTTGFGANTSSNNLFGQTQTSSGSLFGNAATQPQSSVFGTSTANTGFGTSNTFTGANTMSNTQSLFGGANRYGTSTSTNLFSSTASTGLGGFSTQSNVIGTTIKFSPLLSTDVMVKNGSNQNISTRHQCITCMKEYEGKSLEELRYEDYQQNRKGSTSSTMFSSPTTNQTSSLFGGTPSTSVSFNTGNTTSNLFNSKSTFGTAATTTATTSIFNTTFNKSFNSNAPFGSSTTSQPTQTTSLFGSSTTNTGGFGGQQPQSNLFNINTQNTTTKPSFFSNTTTQTNSLFSNTATATNPLAKPMFGSTSAFGQPASSSSTSFNFPSQQSVTTSTSLFPSNQTTNLFGNTATANTQPKSMFNFPTQTAGIGTANTSLNTIGQPTSSSLFGNTTGGLGTSTNLFGNMGTTNTIGTSSSLFGNTNSTPNLLGSSMPNQTNILSLQQISSPTNQQNNDLLMNRLQSLPYGSSSLFQNKVGSPTSQSSLKFTTDPKVLNKYKVAFSNNSSDNQLQRVPINSIKNTSSLLFDGLDDENPEDKKTAFNIFVPRKNIKKLTIKPKENLTNDNSTASLNNEELNSLNNNRDSLKIQLTTTNNNLSTGVAIAANNKKQNETTVNQHDNTVLEYFRQPPKAYASTPASTNLENVSSPNNNLQTIQSPGQSTILEKTSTSANKIGPSHHHIGIINSPETSLVTSLNDSQNYSILGPNDSSPNSPQASNLTYSIPKCKVILTKPEYFTVPPLDQLDSEDETCIVESFTVGREGYGSIYWEGPLDIYGINLDEAVHIRRKEVIVYPDDENKPEEGFGLNRPAQITLHKVWPVDKTTHELIKDPQRLLKMNYSEKIENATIKFGGIFKEYRPETGSWVFKVKHFSKYGLVDDDDDDENMQTDNSSKNIKQKQFNKQNESKQHIIPTIENSDYYQRNNVDQGRLGVGSFNYPMFDVGVSPIELQQPRVRPFSTDYNDQPYFNRQILRQQEKSDNKLFLNLDSDETTTDGMLDDEEEEDDDDDDDELMDENYSTDLQRPVKNTYNDLVRNALFENDDKQNIDFEFKNATKKSKLFKNQLITDQDEYFEKQASSFSFIQPKYTQKTEIILKPDDYPARNKVYYDISSIKCSPVPKVRFVNGLNNFIVIDGRNVNICKLKLIPNLDSSNLNERFELQLRSNSEKCVATKDKAPYIQVKQTIDNKYNIDRLEKLVKALYGSLDGISTEHEYNQERINRIIDWLTEQNRKLNRPSNLYDRIIYYLASNEIKLAVDDLINSNHPKLATLICSGNNFAIKNNVCQQLLEWKQLQGDLFISEDLLKIYVLLSGERKYRLSNNHQIDVLENLEWTQQLSLLLLYSIDCELENCIKNMTCKTNDVEYHLIANNDPLIAMSSADNDLESWFLQQSLKSYGIIKPETNSNIQHGLLASELICQDIKWSCFVACHITHDLLREYTLKELLFNFVQQLTDEIEEWLKLNLNISSKYIASVKAIYAKSKFNLANLGTELLECEEWINAHDVLVENIFPELVINEEHNKLRELIDKLKPHCEIIPNWFISGGHLFDIYCQCVNSEKIDIELLNQPFNFNLMKCTNNRQRLSQSEMARKINLIYHEFNKEGFLINTPVPSDYALKELRFNCRSILKELCS